MAEGNIFLARKSDSSLVRQEMTSNLVREK